MSDSPTERPAWEQTFEEFKLAIKAARRAPLEPDPPTVSESASVDSRTLLPAELLLSKEPVSNAGGPPMDDDVTVGQLMDQHAKKRNVNNQNNK
jgi:hypothetical protein